MARRQILQIVYGENRVMSGAIRGLFSRAHFEVSLDPAGSFGRLPESS